MASLFQTVADPFGIFGINKKGESKQPTLLEIAQQFGPAAQEYFNTTKNIAPQSGQLQLDLLRNYGIPIAQTQQDYFSQAFPQTSKLREALSTSALEGMNAGLTPNELRIVNDAVRSSVGSQATSGLGVNRLAGSILNATNARQQQYQNLGLSLANQIPIAQPTIPQYTDFTAQFSPSSAMSYANQAYANLPQSQGIGSLLQPLGQLAGMFLGGPVGAASGGVIGNSVSNSTNIPTQSSYYQPINSNSVLGTLYPRSY